MSAALPTIAVTAGDPAGIGPEVVAKAVADPAMQALAHWRVIDTPRVDNASPGVVSAECGHAAIEYVKAAVEMCLRGEADAMVTAPVNKEAVALNGIPFSGHTEFIARLCGNADTRMLLVGEKLRVIHVSTHIALREACRLDQGRILRTIELGHEAMRRMGFAKPRIAVCGLNPHAGENRLFGEEDAAFIKPAIAIARERGIRADGPHPPDTVFLRAVRGQYDLVVAMYHDQGHIPMKLLDFEGGVNVSVGLPIVRTSVDHGTAFDIAGKGIADPTSMKAAMRLAVTLAGKK